MNVLPKSAVFTRLFKMLVVSLALMAAGVVGAQGASAAPAADAAAIQSPPAVAASWECVTDLYRNGLERSCNVYSGEIRSRLGCSNGVNYYTPWLGRGSYFIRQVCPSGYVRTSSGVQYRG